MKEQFKITLNASREKVWDALFTDQNYRYWTSVFAEGSWVDTTWQKGSKALFLDSKNDGMSSVIEENIPSEFLSIRHMGTVLKGEEYLNRPEDDEWRGGHENYTLKESHGKTELTVDLEFGDIGEKMVHYFKETWPKALDLLKAIAEKN
ncbi:ATPase [Sphingobacteriaceae bacterium]|nr:ATPase [Sphingobacteriaceae bacterium]